MIVNIDILDNDTGVIRKVGSNPHDSLEVRNGKVEYHNMQNGCGTIGGTYEFVEPKDIDDYIYTPVTIPEEEYPKRRYEEMQSIAITRLIMKLHSLDKPDQYAMAEYALKKMIPYKPKFRAGHGICRCGAYNGTLNKYCGDCGQKLDWSGFND